MNIILKIICAGVLCICTFISSSEANASIALPWSTTFNCDEWQGGGGGATPNCSGLGGTYDDSDKIAQITTNANNPNGDGGRGLRYWLRDGVNLGSDVLNAHFATPQKELWVRFYVRYQQGFRWSPAHYQKFLYFLTGVGANACPGWADADTIRITNGLATVSADGYGWRSIFGKGPNNSSDGSWHCFEFHVKMDTNGTNGVGEIWVDGVKRASASNLNWSEGSATARLGWTTMLIGCNQSSPSNAGGIGNPAYMDYDDIAISNTGYIGTIGSVTPSAPVANFSATPLSGTSPLTVSFADTSTNNPTSWAWDFDNNGTTDSTAQNPSCNYSAAGTYSVKLTVTNAGGSNSITRANYVTVSAPVLQSPAPPSGTLFTENFENSSLSSRGWYDNTNIQLSTTQRVSGSTASAEFRFPIGATQPVSGAAMRKKFTETDSVYVSFYIKYSSNWTGSNQSYHPHQFYLLTNKNGDYDGMAYTNLTVYIEENEGQPIIAIQDGSNIDETKIGQDLTNVSENRSVAGCNGDSDGYGNGSCYVASSSVHWNGKMWRKPYLYFSDNAGPYYKGDWHFVEAYIKLNSISSGKAAKNGVIKYWYDGNLVMDYNNVVFRTAKHSDMKFNQFVIAPWIGDGSPVDQTFWVDNLTIATTRPEGVSDTTPPSNPAGVNVIVKP